jgi:putative ABC transport system substrate-binding protein
MVLPRLARVLVFYNQAESQPLIERARRDLRQLAAEVVGLPVESTAQIRTLYQRHARGVDAVWFMNDPFVMTPEVFAFLRDRTQRDRIPFVASLSDTFARQGALMSISTELAAIGSQAAAMVRLHLEQHQTPAQIGVQPPISTRLTLNQGVARRIGVQVPDEVLPYIGEIVDEPVRSR